MDNPIIRFIPTDAEGAIALPEVGKQFSTARVGAKHLERAADGGFQSEAQLVKTGDEGNVLGTARLKAIYAGPLDETPLEFLVSNHDETCRTVEGLLARLRVVYEDAEIQDKGFITALLFERTS